ncbi:MAG TPA: phosphoserine transaminase [Acidimicrobiales bacterium]|nr:phosphoserine transaminase [Acidimicrobiales bacterium]
MTAQTPTDPPDIRIPPELLPADGRFASGPGKVRTEAVAALAAAAPTYLGTSHRQAGVRTMVGRLRAGLAELFGLPEGYQVVLGNGGTTCFWDIAACCLIEARSQHLVFGEFSGKFASVAERAPHLAAPEVIESPAGTHPEARANPEVDLYALTHNETSTGVAMSLSRPQGAETGLVAVDATSGAGGLPLDPREVDVYYFAPQKCFAADGGLWVALLSPAAQERTARIAASGRWIPDFLDLGAAMENSAKNQTLNTPSLATIFLMVDQVEWLLGLGGLAWATARCDRSAEILYGWAEAASYAWPFVAKPDDRSHVVATVDVDPAVDAAAVARVLRNNGILDTEPYRKLGRNQLRVAMFPAIEPDDVAALTHCVDHVVESLGR